MLPESLAHFFVSFRLRKVLVHQQLKRILEDILDCRIGIDDGVVVEVEGAQNHVGEHEVFEFVSLLDLDELELLLVVYVCQDVVPGVALDTLLLFAAFFFADLSPICGPQQLDGVIVDTLDTEHVIRIDFRGIPNLLVVARQALPEGWKTFVDVIGEDVPLEFLIATFHANEFVALD